MKRLHCLLSTQNMESGPDRITNAFTRGPFRGVEGGSESREHEIIKSLVSMDSAQSHNNRNINNVD